MANFLVFAGTTEGRRLVELLHASGAAVCASVATEYGKACLPEDVKVFAERLGAEEMTTLMQSLNFDCVIDATHPYAAQATENIQAACAFADVRYIRLLRPSGEVGGCVYVENVQKAVEAISAITGRVLLTTGSKDLEAFTAVSDYQARLCPRILPVLESLEHCLNCGYQVQNILAVQGPFSREANGAMMRQMGASVLVTKESGESGGFAEKLLAAQDVGATVVVIGRPGQETGMPFDELVELLERDYAITIPQAKASAPRYFPLFVDLQPQKVVVVGGGSRAADIVKTLQPFAPRMVVIAPQFHPNFDSLEVIRIERPYMQGDCGGSELVLAVSDNSEINDAVVREAKSLGLFVYVEGAPVHSDFQIPQVEVKQNYIVGTLKVDVESVSAEDIKQQDTQEDA